MMPLANPADLWARLGAAGDRPFLVGPDRSFSHAQLAARMAAFAALYERQGLTPGDRLVILLADETEACAALAAAMLRGIVPSLLSPESGAARVAGICGRLEAGLLLAQPETRAEGWQGRRAAPPPVRTAGLGLARAVSGLWSRQAPAAPLGPVPRGPDDPAYILFTSGTTAEPSGVPITWANLSAHLATLIRLFGFGPEGRVFNPTPLGHTDGLVFGPLLALATGGAVLRPGPFRVADLDAWLGQIAALRASHVVTNPTVLTLVARYASGDDAFRVPGFRGVICSASILRPDLWQDLESRFGIEIWNLYGLTETVTSALYAGRHPEMGAIGSIGRPIDCAVRLGGPAGEPLPATPGSEGEIQVQGAHVFGGYWRNPARNGETFTPDGWMRTGDLARLRADGSYDFLGRRKAAINCGGTLIRGEEIDECLLRHPAVAEAVTVALPDPDFEEVPVSAVVLASPVAEAALTAHARAGLELLKVPKRIVAVDAIPRGDSGKPQLAALRALLAERVAVEPVQADGPEATVHGLAAEVFRVDLAELTPLSGPDDVPGWDSFTHLNLILAVEQHYNIRIPAAQVAAIRSLDALVAAVRAQLR